jgi:hypothetical protein
MTAASIRPPATSSLTCQASSNPDGTPMTLCCPRGVTP